jgi:H/ACA ribonucleoprotein complex non-core subunit NAF1
MADSVEPPAKRARFDEPEGHIPGSPIDDMDDDFYESTPVKPSPLPVDKEGAVLPSAYAAPVSTSQSSFHIPGLGLLSNPFAQDASAKESLPTSHEAEDGEISDSASLYNETEPVTLAPGPEPAAAALSTGATVAEGAVQTNGHVGHGQPPLQDPAYLAANTYVDVAVEPVSLPEDFEEGELSDDAGPNDAIHDKAEQADVVREEFLRVGEANRNNAEAEWQLDSEASDSSSDSSSEEGDSSSHDEDDSDDGELLDPEEQVRRLLAEATDDAGASGPAKVRTLNEVAEQFEKPDITITDSTPITRLGLVESVVDNMVLIKGNASGDLRVVETGSALCLGNRTIIGKVSETLGRVQEPRYSLGFTDAAEIGTLQITKGTPIFYVNEHSTFVLTEPLKLQKFTDASNLHDEETNEVEFSDDEKESEFKKKLKEAKKAKAEANREPQDRIQHIPRNDAPPSAPSSHYQGGGLNYGSDEDEDLGMYKPLARPDHFEDIVGAGAPLEDRSHVRRGNMRGRGGWPDRGRGFRGRGGPIGGGGGGGRGGGPPTGPARGDHGSGGRGRGDGGPGRGRGSQRGGRGGVPTGPSGKGGKHQNQNQNPPQQEKRSASSASPNRQNYGRAQNQRSPQRGNKKQRRRGPSPAPASRAAAAVVASPGPSNTNAYAQNSGLASNAWSTPSASYAPQPQASYTGYAPPSQPGIPAGSYVNPAFYGQAPPAQNPQNPQNPQQQQHLAQWAQWFQLAAAMSQQPQHQQAPPPQPPAPSVDPRQNTPQSTTPSLQDILRALGGGAQNR